MAIGDIKMFYYTPSVPAAAVFCALFAITTFAHVFYMFKYRSWYYIPFVFGGCMNAAGFGIRILCAQDINAIGPFIGQSIPIVLAPVFYAATIYMVYGRIVHFVGVPSLSVLPPRAVTPIFVTCDVISFVIQGSGSGLMSSGGDYNKFLVGSRVVAGGLAFQVITLLAFTCIGLVFRRRAKVLSLVDNVKLFTRHQHNEWQDLLIVILVSAILIAIRSIFRTVEYATGYDGYIERHEWFLYVFEASLMAITSLVMLLVPAGSVLGKGGLRTRDQREGLSQKAQSTAMGTNIV